MRIDTDALESANNDAVVAADAANAAMLDLETKHAALVAATRAYNAALEDTKSKFETAGRKITAIRDVADGLASQTGDFPEAVEEPAAWPQAPVNSSAARRRK